VISLGGLIPLGKDRVEVTKNQFASSPVEDLDKYFNEKYKTNPDWDRVDYSPLKPQQSLRIRLRTTFDEKWRVLNPLFGA
jgi:hypothetical protein